MPEASETGLHLSKFILKTVWTSQKSKGTIRRWWGLFSVAGSLLWVECVGIGDVGVPLAPTVPPGSLVLLLLSGSALGAVGSWSAQLPRVVFIFEGSV